MSAHDYEHLIFTARGLFRLIGYILLLAFCLTVWTVILTSPFVSWIESIIGMVLALAIFGAACLCFSDWISRG